MDDLQRFVVIGFVDLDHQVGADTMTVQEDHDLLDLFLLMPGFGDMVRAIHADAGDFQELLETCLTYIEGILLENTNDPFCQFGKIPLIMPEPR